MTPAACKHELFWGRGIHYYGAHRNAHKQYMSPPTAVSSNLKSGGAPEQLAVLLEGESLFNDASGLVLFDIFIKKLAHVGEGWVGVGPRPVLPSAWS